MLPRLSLPFSNKVKHYIAIALHTIKRQPYGSCQLPITRLQNMIISYNKIQHHALTISHHNIPCKNKLDVLYFVVASFTWLLRAEQEPFLPTHQNHNDSLSNRLRFNLRKDRAQPYLVQLKLERQSPASHLCAKHVEGTGLA